MLVAGPPRVHRVTMYTRPCNRCIRRQDSPGLIAWKMYISKSTGSCGTELLLWETAETGEKLLEQNKYRVFKQRGQTKFECQDLLQGIVQHVHTGAEIRLVYM